MIELYINCDCDVHSPNVVERITEDLCNFLFDHSVN